MGERQDESRTLCVPTRRLFSRNDLPTADEIDEGAPEQSARKEK